MPREHRPKEPVADAATRREPTPSWQRSTDPEGHEILLSTAERWWLVRGAAAGRLLSRTTGIGTADPPAEVEGGPAPTLLSDVPCATASDLWDTAEALLSLLDRVQGQAYLYCERSPAALFSALAAARNHSPVTPLFLYAGNLHVGPTIGARTAPCCRCWSERLRRNLPALAVRIARGHLLIRSTARPPGELVAMARQRWERSPIRNRGEHALVLDLATGATRRERLLPTPGCSCRGALLVGSLGDLEGRSFGIVHSVGEPDPSAPLAVLSALSYALPELAQGGASGLDPRRARIRTLAEVVERLAAQDGARGALAARHHDLPDAPPLAALQLYLDSQYDQPGFSCIRPTATREMRWLGGQRAGDDERCTVPACFVTLDPRCAEPRLAPQTGTGIAAAEGWQNAWVSALLEVVERDCATRAWYGRTIERLAAASWAGRESAALDRAGYEVVLGHCPDAPCPVAVAWVGRPADRLGAYGSAARLELEAAAVHAIEEACLMHVFRTHHDNLCRRSPAWDRFPFSPPDEVRDRAQLDRLIAAYRPVVVELTDRLARAVGMRVAAVWSEVAVDFPAPLRPLPLARWQPDAESLERLRREAGIFTPGGRDPVDPLGAR